MGAKTTQSVLVLIPICVVFFTVASNLASYYHLKDIEPSLLLNGTAKAMMIVQSAGLVLLVDLDTATLQSLWICTVVNVIVSLSDPVANVVQGLIVLLLPFAAVV